MKILICGLPRSGKSTVAEILSWNLHAVWINADAINDKYGEYDLSPNQYIKQAERLSYIADGVQMTGHSAVIDFVAPTKQSRTYINPDKTIWMNTINDTENDYKFFEHLTPDENFFSVDTQFTDKDNVVKELIFWLNNF